MNATGWVPLKLMFLKIMLLNMLLMSICGQNLRSGSVQQVSHEKEVVSMSLFDEFGEDHGDKLHDPESKRRLLENDEVKLQFELIYIKKVEVTDRDRRDLQTIDNATIPVVFEERKIGCNDLQPAGQLRSLAEDLEVTVHEAAVLGPVPNITGMTTSLLSYRSNTLMSKDFECVVTFAHTSGSGKIQVHGLWRNDRNYEDFSVMNCTEGEGTCVVVSDHNEWAVAGCEYSEELNIKNSSVKAKETESPSQDNISRRLENNNQPLPFELERWEGCYPGMNKMHELSIGVAVGSEMSSRLGGRGYVLAYLEALISEVNVIFVQQLNVKLLVKAVEIVSPSAAGAVIWDNPGCHKSLRDQLTAYRASIKPSQQAIWHLIDDCWESGAIGATARFSLCNQGSNSAISWFREIGGTWLIFAHEVGHMFGAAHSFEEGQGETGGIMDYGDHLYNENQPLNEYQFNRKYRYYDLCETLQDKLECEHWRILTDDVISNSRTCGNNRLDAGEECECEGGRLNCDCCSRCRLKPTAQCSPFSNDCCADNCKYHSTNIMCSHSDGPGYCRNGHCASSQCALAGRGDYCGVQSEEEPCKKRCEYLDDCRILPNMYYKHRNLRYMRDGAFCTTPTVSFGQCFDGDCVLVASEPGTYPTPYPVVPTANPTEYPTRFPTAFPTMGTVLPPSDVPSAHPTKFPSKFPILVPTPLRTEIPTSQPTQFPTKFPTANPTDFPSASPTNFPTESPTISPTNFPTKNPTQFPTDFPSTAPTDFPTIQKSTAFPTEFPTHLLEDTPTTNSPTKTPTTKSPTYFPTGFPTKFPTSENNDDPAHTLHCCETLMLLYGRNSFEYYGGPGLEVCGATLWAGKDCSPETFEAASGTCASAGARLCTVAEIQQQVVQGSGCDIDRSLAWTSIPCVDSYGRNGYFAASGTGTGTVCSVPSAQLPVACCANACARGRNSSKQYSELREVPTWS